MTAPQHAVPDALRIDPAHVAGAIQRQIRLQVGTILNRRGVVLGISGGIDSSVVAALCARALGKDRVLGLILPERESSPDSVLLARELAQGIGIRTVHENIEPMLQAAGCYERRDQAIRRTIPEFSEGWKCKLVIAGAQVSERFPMFHAVVESPSGCVTRMRLSLDSYLEVVAATNLKQRTRKMLEYYHAEALHYAVAGTANRLEYDLGFFVKNGDGAADLKPIAHLYKTQVYALAEHLNVPASIRTRVPTSDTYPLAQSQEEFFFGMPLHMLDLVLHGCNEGISPREVADAAGMTEEEVQRCYRRIEAIRRTTRFLHSPPLLCSEPSAKVRPAS